MSKIEQSMNVGNWIQVPLEDFEPESAMIYIGLFGNKIPMMVQYMNPHWESIPVRNKIEKGLTHIIVPKEYYVDKWLKKNYHKLFVMEASGQVYNVYNNIANVYHGYGDIPVYEVNNIFFKLKLIQDETIINPDGS